MEFKTTNVSKGKLEALVTVAVYIISCDNKEYDDYVTYCDDNGLNPSDIQGAEQVKHVYAQALIGLGLEFPTD